MKKALLIGLMVLGCGDNIVPYTPDADDSYSGDPPAELPTEQPMEPDAGVTPPPPPPPPPPDEAVDEDEGVDEEVCADRHLPKQHHKCQHHRLPRRGEK